MNRGYRQRLLARPKPAMLMCCRSCSTLANHANRPERVCAPPRGVQPGLRRLHACWSHSVTAGLCRWCFPLVDRALFHVFQARGPKKHLKRVAAPKHWMLDKLTGVFVSTVTAQLCGLGSASDRKPGGK